jgi:hypothetical protein
MRPIIPNPTRLDSHDDEQNFGGVWTTYRPQKGHFIDLYYLYLDNNNLTVQQGINRAPTTVHTVGSRYTGDKNQWLWDVELAGQFGEQTRARDVTAGMATVGGGYHFKDLPLNPTFWCFYDFASGDMRPNRGNTGTFNQLFPFGHYYLGWGDWIGRQNIQDFNMHLFFYPTNYITVWTQYHNFSLVSSRDAVYNIGGAVSKVDATGRSGTHVGQEIDLTVNFHLTKHQDLMFGYSRLFPGSFLESVGPASGADLFYAMYSFRW